MLSVNKQFSNNDQTLLHHKSLGEDSTPRDFFCSNTSLWVALAVDDLN